MIRLESQLFHAYFSRRNLRSPRESSILDIRSSDHLVRCPRRPKSSVHSCYHFSHASHISWRWPVKTDSRHLACFSGKKADYIHFWSREYHSPSPTFLCFFNKNGAPTAPFSIVGLGTVRTVHLSLVIVGPVWCMVAQSLSLSLFRTQTDRLAWSMASMTTRTSFSNWEEFYLVSRCGLPETYHSAGRMYQ